MHRPPAVARRPRRRAFTLVELLVVIGIIGLLVSILLPSLAAARKQAQSVACRSNLRQVAMAALMYGQEQGKYVGYAAGTDRKMLLYPYIGQGKDNADVQANQVWNCPANEKPETQCGYGLNTNLNWVKLTQIKSWPETVAVCDSGVRDGPNGGVDTLSTMCNPPSKSSPTGNPAYRPNPRHPNRTANVAFVDAHVEAMPMGDVFYPGPVGKWSGNDVTNPAQADYKDWLWDLY